MRDDLYSVEQVAERLNLHVRTVRGYIRSGRLKAVRIGKQYRINGADLDALTGIAAEQREHERPFVEVSSIVQVDGVDRHTADRLETFVLAAANSRGAADDPLRVQLVHDGERERMKIILIGGAGTTAEMLRLLDAILEGNDG
ncbi:helix-turn-helix domain-containing protein [Dactylosporangium sp. AC04546]|uniref:helix-turn-helix domain-containing protein n=1 Tax=Dactylosporangium sp. AC04546 TaxID=2862460 RepID=UPI001EDED5DA|nr:helix-turn-helix domain-containing protein [Dactylosporangium sp. AC04546]WVK87870.1 helix-turn-helix domain-containing protein [Dactylosporangium sp. AC04546]